MGVLFGTTSLLGFRLIRRYGSRVVAVGAAVVVLGLLLIVWEVAQPGRPGLGWLMVALLLVGGGNGLVLPQILGLAMTEVRANQAGAGSGMLNTTVQFAGSAGVAAIGAAFFALADSGYDRAMVCSALLDAGLMLVVFGLVARLAFRGRRATATV
jgi:predicted MFS family arabinose efflux permease